MTSKRLFRQEHPVILSFLILGAIFLLFWGGITFFISRTILPKSDFFSGGEGIGVIELKGIIISADDVIEQLSSFSKDLNVRV